MALGLVAAVTGLVAVELVWRLVFADSKGLTTRPGVVVADPWLGWRHGAGLSVRHRHDGSEGQVEFDVLVRTDERGSRTSAAAEAARGRSGRPVVFLGDSLTFGWGVEEEETFVARVREALTVPVVNLGVSGHGAGQECLVLEREALARNPAVVVLTFCPNDVAEAASMVRYGRSKPRFSWDGTSLQAPYLPLAPSWLERHSGVYRRIRQWTDPPIELGWEPAERTAARQLVRALHRRMAELCQAGGARFVLLSAQGGGWLDPPEPTEWVDLRPAFERAAAREAVVFPSDAHWTAAGHAAVAEQLLQRLR